jgi:hypothetical protein
VFWAVLCLAVFWLIGRWRAEDRRWRWADPVYYPLGIVGILLLFLNNESSRAVGELRDQRAAIDAELQTEQAKEPIRIGETGAGWIARSYALIDNEAGSIRTCVKGIFNKCQFQSNQFDAIEAAYKDFQAPVDPKPNPVTAKVVTDFCARGDHLVEILAEKSTSSVFPELRSSLADQKKQARAGSSANSDATIKEALRRKLLYAGNDFFAKFEGETRGIVALQWKADEEFAELVFDALAPCARIAEDAPAQLSAQEERRTKVTELESEKKAKDDAIARLQGAVAPTWFERAVNFSQTQLWPFVLVLALALKFGKGIAGFRARAGA